MTGNYLKIPGFFIRLSGIAGHFDQNRLMLGQIRAFIVNTVANAVILMAF